MQQFNRNLARVCPVFNMAMDQSDSGPPLIAIPPGISPGESPAFHKLGEYRFQELCRDLLCEEPGVASCDVYGIRGQRQYGIDLLAYRENGDGIEVGQCKCYQDFPPAKIREASGEFFSNFDNRWSKENVRRLILFVACDLEERQQQDEISEQRRRFKLVGITYEAWSAATIRNKLRPNPGIVSTYCVPAEYWVPTICGVSPPPSISTASVGGESSAVVQAALVGQLEKLAARTASETERRLESMREAWREGRRNEANAWVRELKGDPTSWSILPAQLRAKILVFEASLELDSTGDLVRVKELAAEAKATDRSLNQDKLQALIALRESGAEAAMELLVDKDDTDTLNLRAALLLEMGRTDDCLALLNLEEKGFASDGDA